jgi:hypothetical protein
MMGLGRQLSHTRLPHAVLALVLAAASLLGTSASAEDSTDSTRPIHVRRVATGRADGMRRLVEVSILACRAVKKLPLNAPMSLPSEKLLSQLLVRETDEYFDGANYASYSAERLVAPDPASGDCQLKVFITRGAWAGQICGGPGVGGDTTALNALTDVENPKPAKVTDTNTAMSRAGCGKKAKVYDVAGLPVEDAGLASCVWSNDHLARSMKAAGLPATGHKEDSRAIDACLYVKQPIYSHDGHHLRVVLKRSVSTEGDVADSLHGMITAANERLDGFSDGSPIDPYKFSAASIRSFLAQPVKLPLGDSR